LLFEPLNRILDGEFDNDQVKRRHEILHGDDIIIEFIMERQVQTVGLVPVIREFGQSEWRLQGGTVHFERFVSIQNTYLAVRRRRVKVGDVDGPEVESLHCFPFLYWAP
jgi:hypothetical protein